jgi:hypothetical protein
MVLLNEQTTPGLDNALTCLLAALITVGLLVSKHMVAPSPRWNHQFGLRAITLLKHSQRLHSSNMFSQWITPIPVCCWPPISLCICFPQYFKFDLADDDTIAVVAACSFVRIFIFSTVLVITILKCKAHDDTRHSPAGVGVIAIAAAAQTKLDNDAPCSDIGAESTGMAVINSVALGWIGTSKGSIRSCSVGGSCSRRSHSRVKGRRFSHFQQRHNTSDFL